jgi:hypothetical protein
MPLLKAAGCVLAMAFCVMTFRSLGPAAAEFKPPAPSAGDWDHEGPGDERPNEPSIFMVDQKDLAPTLEKPSTPDFGPEE